MYYVGLTLNMAGPSGRAV